MSGKLGFEDYKQLWSDLLLCKVSCVQGCGLGLEMYHLVSTKIVNVSALSWCWSFTFHA